ncbi:MFS transporter [Phenylobacterium sp.]|uniref:MFS transporter n=1 Tax=Phenylobacterium sp. TaxID=1871053 RepID=UPI0035B10AAC
MTSPAPPAPPDAPPYDWRKGVVAAAMSVLVGVTQGLGINLVTANLPAIQGALGATPVEGAWIVAAYMATSVSASVLLVKFRFQFGLRLFADLGLGLFIVVTAAHLFANTLGSAIAVRAAQGIAAAPLASLSLFYMMGAFPPEKRTTGVALGIAASQLGVPLSRVISPELLQIGQWHGLYLLELGLALICFAGVAAFRLPPVPQALRFERADFVSFALFAPGLGLLAIVLSLGRFVWWTEAPWLGVCLALSIVFLAAANLFDLHRKQPLVDVRWLSTAEMVRFAVAIVLFRIALSEQTVGAVGFFTTLGLANEQMATLFWIVLACTVAGFLTAALTLNPERPLTPLMIALVMIIVAAWTDAHSTAQTRPEQMYLTQGMLAFAGALFLPPAMLFGISRALATGFQRLASYVMVFSAGQALGGLAGTALLGTFVTWREKYHSNLLTQGVTLGDPEVVLRLRQLSAAYGRVIADPQLRSAEALALLQQQATREAYVRAYNDAFALVAVLAALTLAWMLLLRARAVLERRRAVTANEAPA